jgi:hypothetical protein
MNHSIKVDHSKAGCEDERQIGLSENRAQWQTFVLAVLNHLVLLSQYQM